MNTDKNGNFKKCVFLCGPMRGIPRSEGIAWRNHAENLLKDNFIVLHAYRGREEKETFPDPRGAIIRDKNDILRSDILLVNDTLAEASMIGTAMEVLFAFEHNKPIIVFGNGHPVDYWLNYHIHTRLNTLEEACELINNLFKD